MRLTWQTSQLIGLAVVSMLMTLISPADAGSVTNRIDGFQVPQIVSDSVTAEFAGLLDRLGVIATTTGFFEALIAPVCILVALAGLRAIGARTSKRATRTRPDNVFKFEPRARSLKRRPSRTNAFRNVSLNAVGVILIVGFFALSNTSV